MALTGAFPFVRAGRRRPSVPSCSCRLGVDEGRPTGPRRVFCRHRPDATTPLIAEAPGKTPMRPVNAPAGTRIGLRQDPRLPHTSTPSPRRGTAARERSAGSPPLPRSPVRASGPPAHPVAAARRRCPRRPTAQRAGALGMPSTGRREVALSVGSARVCVVDELVERVDDQDRVLGVVVSRRQAVLEGWLHRVAVTVCRDERGRILVHRRSEQLSRFPGLHEVVAGGAVGVGESYEQAAARELAEELGIRVLPRLLFTFINRSGLSPHWLGVHEVVVPDAVVPDADEVAWHGWLTEPELRSALLEWRFTPDSHVAFRRYLAFRTGPSPGPPADRAPTAPATSTSETNGRTTPISPAVHQSSCPPSRPNQTITFGTRTASQADTA